MIHSSSKGLDAENFLEIDDFYVCKRPCLDEFLMNCSKDFKLAIWSAATQDYVAQIVEKIIPETLNLEFGWSRSKSSGITFDN